MSTKTVDQADEAFDTAVAAIRTVAATLAESDAERDCLEDDLLGTVQAAMFREGAVPTVARQTALNTMVTEFNDMTELVMLLVDLMGDIQAGKGRMKLPGFRKATADKLSKSGNAFEQARLRLTEIPARDDDSEEGEEA